MGLAPEAFVTITLVRPWQVNTLTPLPTDVRLGALIHIYTSDFPMIHQELVAMETTAAVGAFCVNADASSMATWLSITLIIIHTGVPLRVEPVTSVALTLVASVHVDTLPMATKVPVQPALVCLW